MTVSVNFCGHVKYVFCVRTDDNAEEVDFIALESSTQVSHQVSVRRRGETEPVGLRAVHEGGVELCGVHAQERGQGDGNVEKLDKWEVPGQSLGHPPFPAFEVVVVLRGDGDTL